MYYHVSFWKNDLDIGDTKIFKPRIPINGYLDKFGDIVEDTCTPRVCLSSTILGCLMATNLDIQSYSYLSVYTTENIPNIFIPIPNYKDNKYPYKGIVPDCDITNEVWSLEPIELILLYKFDWSCLPNNIKTQHQKLLLQYFKHDSKMNTES